MSAKNGKNIKCNNCGKEFYIPKCKFHRSKYCSKICLNKKKETMYLGEKNPFYGKTHSEEFSIKRSGKNHHWWKSGKRKRIGGYIEIKSKSHPMANCSGYVFEHRLIMEKKLGRYLMPTEVVHHINHKTDDNRIENLMLFPSNVEHKKFHKKERENNKK